jgi:hypothetical protein
VPSDAYWLIATRFPYLSMAQLNQILATTELPSGVPLDNGTGWAGLNLYAAAGGYGAFPNNVTVNMNAALAALIQVGGTATLSGSTVVATSIGNSPALSGAYPILTAIGGISGSFNSLTEPTSGLAAGTRFDTLYGSNTISLVTTPSFYGNLAAAGVAASSSESSVGGALDAIRPAPGVAMDSAQSALFGPLYTLPAGSITAGLDELAPSIYADGMITARNSWYLMANAVSGQLAARRGLAADNAANSAPGPNGSTIWVSGLAGYCTTGAGGGSPWLYRRAGWRGGRHRYTGGRHRACWRGGRNSRRADLVADQRAGHKQHGAVCDLWPMAERDVLCRGATRSDVSTGECASDTAAVRRNDAGRHQRAGRRRRHTCRHAAKSRRVADRAEPRLRWLRFASA